MQLLICNDDKVKASDNSLGQKAECNTGCHMGGPLENSHPFSQPRPHTYTHLTVDSNEEEDTMLLAGEY